MNKQKLFSITIIFVVILSLASLSFNSSAKLPAASSPNLGAAGSFSVLAALSMSSAGAAGTTVVRDLGLSPGLEVSRTGVWHVGGTEYFGPTSKAGNAQTAALAAFNNMAGQTADGTWGAQVSLVPGVWKVASDKTFTGTLTLTGTYDDVWVIQVGRDMTFSGSVALAGNAQACHVFWQIGRDVTIAGSSSFAGTLIALRDITLASGATVNGRVMSLTGALTTIGNTINGPSCASAPAATNTTAPVATNTTAPVATNTFLPATQTAIVATLAPTLTAQAATQTAIVATLAPTLTARAATLTAIATLGLTPGTPFPPIVGLPSTGGGPIQNEAFPWGLLLVGGFSLMAVSLGVRAYRRSQ